jgi:hypothetical protein
MAADYRSRRAHRRGKPHGRSSGTAHAEDDLRYLRLPHLRLADTGSARGRAARRPSMSRTTIMLFTIFCCISTGLVVYCILSRVNKRAVEIAVRLAVREVEKEYEQRNATMAAQLSSKDGELKKARDKAQQLVKMHEVVASNDTFAAKPPAKGSAAAKSAKEKLKREGLEVFAMSRPFTDSSYDALLAATDVVKVEPKAV